MGDAPWPGTTIRDAFAPLTNLQQQYIEEYLIDRIGDILQARVGSAGALVRERHRLAVTAAIVALAESRAEVVRTDSRVELAAEHLRQAVRALDALVGRVDVDDLLGEIFASFCIGK